MPPEMFWILVGAVPSAVIAMLLQWIWNRSKGAVQSGVSSNRSARHIHKHENLHSVIANVYASERLEGGLYRPTAIAETETAILFDPKVSVRQSSSVDDLVVIDDAERKELGVSQRIINMRLRAGGKLWDGDLLYLRSAEMDEDQGGVTVKTLHAGVTNYFSHVTSSERWRRTLTRGGIREVAKTNYRSLTSLLQDPPAPVALSAAAVCAFWTDDGWRIPMSMRSSSVVNAMGRAGVIPTFGFESNQRSAIGSQFGVVTFNFMKEFLEELGGNEDAEHSADSEAVDPDAIFSSPLAKDLMTEFETGGVSLKALGLGGELTDGSISISLLAVFSRPEFYRRVMREAHLNWEWHQGRDRLILWQPEDDPASSPLLKGARLANTSVLALDLALPLLRGQNPTRGTARGGASE